MSQIWMVPLALLVGLFGTCTVLKLRHTLKNTEKDWWVTAMLFWTPLLCWIGSQIAEHAH